MNQLHDRIIEIVKIADGQKRTVAMDELLTEHRNAAKDKNFTNDVDELKDLISRLPNEERSAAISIVLNNLWLPGILNFEAHLNKSPFEMQLANFALARFHAKHQRYPLDFLELRNFGIADWPREYDDKTKVVYQSNGGSFVFYSRGRDGLDSGGYFGVNPRGTPEYCDDYAIYSPGREPMPPVVVRPDEDPNMRTRSGKYKKKL